LRLLLARRTLAFRQDLLPLLTVLPDTRRFVRRADRRQIGDPVIDHSWF
jgi:hypothetical protein